MRTITALERSYVGSLRAGHWVRLEIWDSTSTYVDYTINLRNIDWLNSLRLAEHIDQNCMTLNGSLLRSSGTLSLAPFMAASLLNQVGGSYATLLDLWRKWKVSLSVFRENYAPTGSDWKAVGEGRIDKISVGEQITIIGRSEEAVLLQKWISTERQYGSVGGIAMETVLQSMLDDNLGAGVVTLYTPTSPSYLMNTWTQSKGNLMGALVAVAAKAGFTLRYRYDSADSYRLTLFKPNRTATVEDWTLGPSEYTAVPQNDIDLEGVRNLIKERFVHPTLGTQTVISPWQAGTGTVACTAGAATFSVSQAGILKVNSELIIAGIAYTLSVFNGTTSGTLISQLASGGVPTFGASSFTASDTVSGSGTTVSISRFGRVDMELDLSFDTQVNDPTKAQAMTDAVRSDSEFPDLEQQFETLGFWFVQLHDYGRFLADGVHYDADVLAGVTGISIDIADATIRTTIDVRGKPAGGYRTWKMLADASAPSGPIDQQALRDTKPIQLKVVRQSESASQIVSRVYAIAAVAGASVSISYDNGGLTVTPASPQTLVATTDFATTAFVDFTITRDVQTGTPRRIAFAGSAPGYVDGTDGVDVPPNSNRLSCTLRRTAGSTLTSAVVLKIPWDVEDVDNGGFHDNSVNPTRITWPMTGVVALTVQADFNGNATAGVRTITLRNSAAGSICDGALGTAGNRWTAALIKIFAVTAADYVEVEVVQVSGVNETLTGGNQTTKLEAIYLF